MGLVIVVLAVSLVVASTMTIADASARKGEADNHISDEGREHISPIGGANADLCGFGSHAC
jgi:hypothetical protein